MHLLSYLLQGQHELIRLFLVADYYEDAYVEAVLAAFAIDEDEFLILLDLFQDQMN